MAGVNNTCIIIASTIITIFGTKKSSGIVFEGMDIL